MGNQKWQKNLNLKLWKSQTLKFGDFQIQFFFVIFGFPSKKVFFLKVNILLFTKNILGTIASIEKKIY